MSSPSYRQPYHHPSRLYYIGNAHVPHSTSPLPPARLRFWQPSPTRYHTNSSSRSRYHSRSPTQTRDQRNHPTNARSQGDCYPGTRRAHRYRSPSPFPIPPRVALLRRPSPGPSFSANHHNLTAVYSKTGLLAFVPNPQKLKRFGLQERYAIREALMWKRRGEGLDMGSQMRGWGRERWLHERVWGRAVESIGREDRERGYEGRRGFVVGWEKEVRRHAMGKRADGENGRYGDERQIRSLEGERGRKRTREDSEAAGQERAGEQIESGNGRAAEKLTSLIRRDREIKEANKPSKRKREDDDDDRPRDGKRHQIDDGIRDTARNPGERLAEAGRSSMGQKRRRDDSDEGENARAVKRRKDDSEDDDGRESLVVAVR